MEKASSSSGGSSKRRKLDPQAILQQEWDIEGEISRREYKRKVAKPLLFVSKKKIGQLKKAAAKQDEAEEEEEDVRPPKVVITEETPIGMKAKITVPNTTTNIVYLFSMVDTGLPYMPMQAEKARKRALLMPELYKFTTRKPKIAESFKGYFESTLKPNIGEIDIGQGVVDSRGKYMHIMNHNMKKYVAIAYTKEMICKNCNKHVKFLRKNENPEMSKNFKPCCFVRPVFEPIEAKRVSPLRPEITRIHQITYDIETYNKRDSDMDSDDGTHLFYNIGVQIDDEKPTIVYEIEDFFDIVFAFVRRLQRAGKVVVLHLVSFNGSRYDDLFLIEKWRTAILQQFGIAPFKDINYSERKRAVTHNNLKMDNVSIVWCDVSRFTNPGSLRSLCISYGLDVLKGFMPFKVLNNFCLGIKIKRDPQTGFFNKCYFDGDLLAWQEAKEYYEEVIGPTQAFPQYDQDVRRLCAIYCMQDVTSTYLLYKKLEMMFSVYLFPLVMSSENLKGAGYSPNLEDADVLAMARANGFYPMALHSLASMSSRVMVYNALINTHVVYNSETGTSEEKEVTCHAEVGETYDFVRKAMYGGWVRPYYQGFIVAEDGPLQKICNAFDTSCIKEDVVMGDIASMYPNGVTFPMPCGEGVLVEGRQAELFAQVLAQTNPCKIPLFIARVKLLAPEEPTYWESTLPQRDSNGDLSWSYSTAYASDGYQHYTSLDLWLACRAPTSDKARWRVVDIKEMIYWKEGSQLFKDYMVRCAEGKKAGTVEGNKNKRNCFKVSMNSSIGMLGLRAEGRMNVLGGSALVSALESLGHECDLVGSKQISYRRGYINTFNTTEYVLRTRNTQQNAWPQSNSAFMYAATRLMRWEWSNATVGSDNRLPILTPGLLPDPFYGDTDSKIHLKKLFNNIPHTMVGSNVGVFDVEKGVSNMNIELEDVSNEQTQVLYTGILGSKTYFMDARKLSDDSQVLKFRCKGQRQFNAESSFCMFHDTKNCGECKCPHRSTLSMCTRCFMPLLQRLVGYAIVKANPIDFGHILDDPYLDGLLFKLENLKALTLFAFVFTLVTGAPCTTDNLLFDRSLALPTSKLPSFSVRSSSQRRMLSRPTLLHSYTDKPLGICIKDQINFRPEAGTLYPRGEYLK